MLNTLILNPPKLITEYGEEIHVNCSLIEEDPEEMTLLIGPHQAQSENFDSFVSIVAPLTDWNAKGECKIKLNESVECSQELEIIVYSKYMFKQLQSNEEKIKNKSQIMHI